MKLDIVATVGPSILLHEKLRELCEEGVTIFRINGAHGDIKYVRSLIRKIQSSDLDVKILLDIPGNKIRTTNILEPITLNAGDTFLLDNDQVNFEGLFCKLKKGDRILSSDSQLLFEVVESNSFWSRFKAISSGVVLNNKGLHISGIHSEIPFLFRRDKQLIKVAIDEKVDFLGLSFVRDALDIKQVKDILDNYSHGPMLISKIETQGAVENLSNILKEVDFVLIDRGDLSAEIGIERVPKVQNAIISYVKSSNKKVFLATQFLSHMVHHRLPLIAEINEIYHVLEAGISGIQLSEETAIGKYPVECVRIINSMAEQM